MNSKNVSSAVAVVISFFALACSGTDVDTTKTESGKGALNGGPGAPPSSSSTPAPGGTDGSEPGCVSPGQPPAGGGTISSPPSTEPGPGDTGLVLCDASECPQMIPAIAAICPDGSTANFECMSFTKPNEPRKCNWSPVCGL